MKTFLKSFYKIRFLIILAILHLLFVPTKTNAQNALILNGAYIVENGGTATSNIHIVINQPNPLGIVKLSGVGHIHSENQYNFITWHTASNTGSFVFPFGVGGNSTEPIPFTFNKTAGNNTVSISTWTTDQQNNPKPEITNVAAVSYMNGITDSVLYAIDRFWDIQASATTADLTFSYRGSENTTRAPTDLIQAQHWNGSSWDSPVGPGTNGVTSGIGTAGAFTGQNTFSPWVLIIPTCVDIVTINSTICQGDNFVVGSSSYTFSGTYVDTLINSLGCDSIITTILNVLALPNIQVVNLQDVLCFGEMTGEIQVAAPESISPQFVWVSHEISGTYIKDLPVGVYTLEVTDAYSCTSDTSLIVSQPPELRFDYELGHPSCVGYNNGYVEFEVAGGVLPYEYSYEMGESNSPYFSNLYEGEYDFVISDNNNCTEYVSIELIDTNIECISIPNAFTPNDDGTNDTWIINYIDFFNNYHIQVFNRWGQLTYCGMLGDEPWDGSNMKNGKKVPTGSYIYVIKLDSGIDHRSGIVTVVY
jgi:gliding motility-associated-like protein